MVTGASLTKTGTQYSRYIRIGQYVESVWQGRAGERLGIAGMPADERTFQALTDLQHPSTGEVLKTRHKQKITMWDLTIAAPKSASILALYDPVIRALHGQAAAQLPEHQEQLVPSRNMVYAQFEHCESRANDPHLHTHTAILNLTYNAEAQKWECLRPNFMNYWAQHQETEAYRRRFAQALIEHGYEITDRPKLGFEIDGVAPEIIEKFSKRAVAIEKFKEEREEKELNPYQYRQRGYIERPAKQLYAETFDAYLEQQKEKLTHAERISLKETVEIAQERAHKIRIRFDVGDAEESGPELKPWTYGHRLSI